MTDYREQLRGWYEVLPIAEREALEAVHRFEQARRELARTSARVEAIAGMIDATLTLLPHVEGRP